MKRLLVIAAFVVGLAMPALGQDFVAGVAAYERGNYPAALQEWWPLAEHGHASAQYNLGVIYRDGVGVSQDLAQAASAPTQSEPSQWKPDSEYKTTGCSSAR